MTEGGSVILEGKPGRGKTHLAVAIAYRALLNGFDALFKTAADWIDELSTATREGTFREALNRYVKPHVLVVDEVGYLAYGADAANVLFARCRRAAWAPTFDGLRDQQERGRLLKLDGPSFAPSTCPTSRSWAMT